MTGYCVGDLSLSNFEENNNNNKINCDTWSRSPPGCLRYTWWQRQVASQHSRWKFLSWWCSHTVSSTDSHSTSQRGWAEQQPHTEIYQFDQCTSNAKTPEVKYCKCKRLSNHSFSDYPYLYLRYCMYNLELSHEI